MSSFKNPIDQLIKDLGGTVFVAGKMCLAPSVVSTWRKTGRIPKWRVDPLRKLALKEGIPFPLDEAA